MNCPREKPCQPTMIKNQKVLAEQWDWDSAYRTLVIVYFLDSLATSVRHQLSRRSLSCYAIAEALSWEIWVVHLSPSHHSVSTDESACPSSGSPRLARTPVSPEKAMWPANPPAGYTLGLSHCQ